MMARRLMTCTPFSLGEIARAAFEAQLELEALNVRGDVADRIVVAYVTRLVRLAQDEGTTLEESRLGHPVLRIIDVDEALRLDRVALWLRAKVRQATRRTIIAASIIAAALAAILWRHSAIGAMIVALSCYAVVVGFLFRMLWRWDHE